MKTESNNEDNKEDADLSEIPTKCVKETREIQVKCKVVFIDFEGRSDGDSVLKVRI